ncbi:hypothetical protein KAI04_04375 [Candidatus Pacearchaeota archaeon]|nr:hypothetical protein [Candidatus Pacearchaeota archaeon]
MTDKQFRKLERYAKTVINILIRDYIISKHDKTYFWMKNYINLIQVSIEDYQSCGYNMDKEIKSFSKLEKKLNNIKNEN